MQFENAVNYIFNRLANELPVQLSYHNIAHIRDVYEAAEALGNAEKIDSQELSILLTAAAYHDAGFLKAAANHEVESCLIVGKLLPGFNYTDEEISQICQMIMATHLPQTPKSNLDKILADADLDYLGRDDFFTIGNLLFKELQTAGILKLKMNGT